MMDRSNSFKIQRGSIGLVETYTQFIDLRNPDVRWLAAHGFPIAVECGGSCKGVPNG